MPAMLGGGSCWVFVVVVVVFDDCDKCEKLNVFVGLCNKMCENADFIGQAFL